MSRAFTRIGPYVADEVPEPIEYAFLTAAGDPIDLTGYTATFHIHRVAGDTMTDLPADLSVTPTDGTVSHVWATGEMQPGVFMAEFRVTNLTNTYVSDRFKAYVRPAILAPAP